MSLGEAFDSSHGERDPRAWISLTTHATGIGTPGRNGTPHHQSYILENSYLSNHNRALPQS
jgi:hypothetical protein